MTYYEILEVSESASTEVIHMAYKALAKKYHPDRNPGDPTATQRFQKLGQAYETLSDPERRKQYDLLLARQKAQASSNNSYTNNGQYSGNSQYTYNTQHKASNQASSYSQTTQAKATVKKEKAAQYPSSGKSFTVIAVLLFVMFTQTLHPYIESSTYYENAWLLGLIDLAWVCALLMAVPLVIGAILGASKPKHIKTLCFFNSLGFFLLSIVLLIVEYTDDVLIGWIPLVIFYFINKHILFLSRHQSLGKRIAVAFLILACLLGTFYGCGIFLLNSEDNSCDHKWDAATCIEPQRCSLCDEVQGEPLGHTTQTGICTRCHINFGKPVKSENTLVGIRTITLSDKFTAEFVFTLIKQADSEVAVIDIMNEYGSSQGGGKLHEVYPGYWIEECDKWCFDQSRQVGDCEIVENDYGYTILYFSSVLETAAQGLPVSGTAFIGKDLPVHSELTITTSSSHCYIKLKNKNFQDVYSFFVRANDSVAVPVPSGQYYVFFASGKEWYGIDSLFGDGTSYSKDDEICDFENYTWEYTLTESVNGNFSETPISSDEF